MYAIPEGRDLLQSAGDPDSALSFASVFPKKCFIRERTGVEGPEIQRKTEGHRG